MFWLGNEMSQRTTNSYTARVIIQLPKSASQYNVYLRNFTIVIASEIWHLLHKMKFQWFICNTVCVIVVRDLTCSKALESSIVTTVDYLIPSFIWDLHHERSLKSLMVNIYWFLRGAVVLHLEWQAVQNKVHCSWIPWLCRHGQCGPSKRG